MNREDIIRMAREAEFYGDGGFLVCSHEELERFAALVAAAEREACAKACLYVEISEHTFNADAAPMEFAFQVAEATALDCAIAIRARGNE